MASSADLRDTVEAGWEQLPAGRVHHDVADVAVDCDDKVYALTRDTRPSRCWLDFGAPVGDDCQALSKFTRGDHER